MKSISKKNGNSYQISN